MGAGMPMFKTASTMDPLLKNVRSSGYSFCISPANPIHVYEAADVMLRDLAQFEW